MKKIQFISFLILVVRISYGQVEIKSVLARHGKLRLYEVKSTLYLYTGNKKSDSVYYDGQFFEGEDHFTYSRKYSRLEILPDDPRYTYHHPKRFDRSQLDQIKDGELIMEPDTRYTYSGIHPANKMTNYSFQGKKIEGNIPIFGMDQSTQAELNGLINSILNSLSLTNVYSRLGIQYYWASVPSVTAVITKSGRRQLLISEGFYKELKQNEIASIGILAHELYHFIQKAFENSDGTLTNYGNPELEAEADYFAGQILYELFPDSDLNTLFQFMSDEPLLDVYFPKKMRIDTIMAGWIHAKNHKLSAPDRSCNELLNSAKYSYRKKLYRETLRFLEGFKSCKDNTPDEFYVYKGLSFFKIGNSFNSKDTFLELAEKSPLNNQVWEYLGDVYYSLSQVDSSNLCYQKAIALKENKKDSSNIFFKLGRNALIKKNENVALTNLSKSIDLDKNPNSLYLKASIYKSMDATMTTQVKIERLNKSIDLLTEIIESNGFEVSKLKEIEIERLYLKADKLDLEGTPLNREQLVREINNIYKKD